MPEVINTPALIKKTYTAFAHNAGFLAALTAANTMLNDVFTGGFDVLDILLNWMDGQFHIGVVYYETPGQAFVVRKKVAVDGQTSGGVDPASAAANENLEGAYFNGHDTLKVAHVFDGANHFVMWAVYDSYINTDNISPIES